MFFKSIDEWGKAKLSLMTLLCGICYLVFATVIPIVIIANKYDLLKDASFKTSFIGIIVCVFILTAGVKSCKYVFSILPDIKRSQQIVKFSLEMIVAMSVPALVLWVTFLIEKNINTALWCIRGSCYSFFGAIAIEYVTLKPLQVQWRCESKVDEDEKIDAIKNARRSKRK